MCATSQVPSHSVERGEPSKGSDSKRGTSRSPITVGTSPPLRQDSHSNANFGPPLRHSSGHAPLTYVGNLRSFGPENSGLGMECVRMPAPSVNTPDTSQQSMSGIRQNEGGQVSGRFASSTPRPSPSRAGTTAAIDRPPSRHVPCSLPPTRTVSTAPVPRHAASVSPSTSAAPVVPPGAVNDGAGRSGSSDPGPAKQKKKRKIGVAIVKCPECGEQSASQSEHYNHFRVCIFYKEVL